MSSPPRGFLALRNETRDCFHVAYLHPSATPDRAVVTVFTAHTYATAAEAQVAIMLLQIERADESDPQPGRFDPHETRIATLAFDRPRSAQEGEACSAERDARRDHRADASRGSVHDDRAR